VTRSAVATGLPLRLRAPAPGWRVHLDVALDADGGIALTSRPFGVPVAVAW
jgi:hypothetical protein